MEFSDKYKKTDWIENDIQDQFNLHLKYMQLELDRLIEIISYFKAILTNEYEYGVD